MKKPSKNTRTFAVAPINFLKVDGIASITCNGHPMHYGHLLLGLNCGKYSTRRDILNTHFPQPQNHFRLN